MGVPLAAGKGHGLTHFDQREGYFSQIAEIGLDLRRRLRLVEPEIGRAHV